MLTKFGKLVRKHRIDAQMKLGEMAAGVGVSAAYLSAVENGKKNLTDQLVVKVGEFLNLEGDGLRDLRYSADMSRSDFLIDMTAAEDSTKEAVAMFARSVGSASLSSDKAKQILDILNS